MKNDLQPRDIKFVDFEFEVAMSLTCPHIEQRSSSCIITRPLKIKKLSQNLVWQLIFTLFYNSMSLILSAK